MTAANKTAKKATIVLNGATGFIGRKLSEYFAVKGYEVLGLSRDPGHFFKKSESEIPILPWNPLELDGWEKVLKNADIVINLAGENISALRWSSRKKKRILNSRVQSTKILIQALKRLKRKSGMFVQVSGIHFYGSRNNKIVDESSSSGQGFLSEVAERVEALSEVIEVNGTRRILLRTGPVWGSGGGIFPKLLLPFKFFLGGRVGSGKQWISWIHQRDFCRAVEFVISKTDLTGPVNLTSPQPAQNLEMTKILAKKVSRPAFLNIPVWMIKIFLGEMGEELLLSNQRVYPKNLLESGFEFEFPDPEAAVQDILG